MLKADSLYLISNVSINLYYKLSCCSRSDVIIYAVNQTSNYLFERKEVITYINSRIEGEYKSTALYVRILYAEVMCIIIISWFSLSHIIY